MDSQVPQPTFDPAKFKALMLYAAEKSRGDPRFGAIKLNKILFFSDFLSYGLTGRAVTAAVHAAPVTQYECSALLTKIGE